MQEVFGGGTAIRNPNDQFGVLEAIAETADLANSFFAPKYSLDYGGHTIQYGNAMVAKYPLLDLQTHFIKGAYIENIDPASNLTSRDDGSYNVQLARLRVGGTSVTIANHHGYWQADPMGTEVSVECMKNVADILHQVEGPLIFCGDLNVVSQSPAMRVFDGFLEDLTATQSVTSTLGRLHYVQDVACDHILISSDITVKGFAVADPMASDHQALILEFSL